MAPFAGTDHQSLWTRVSDALPAISSWWTIISGVLGLIVGNVIKPIRRGVLRRRRQAAEMASVAPVAPEPADWVKGEPINLTEGEAIRPVQIPMTVRNGSRQTVRNVRFGLWQPPWTEEPRYAGYAEILEGGQTVPGTAQHLLREDEENRDLFRRLVFFARFDDGNLEWETTCSWGGEAYRCTTERRRVRKR